MPATKLSDDDVINLVRKEFDRKREKFLAAHGLKDKETKKEEDDVAAKEKKAEEQDKPDQVEPEGLVPGLRVRHVPSGLHYEIVHVNINSGEIGLETPDGKLFPLSFEEFEREYSLD